jgi:formylglycine-generating enzyme required for sulfatase activity
MCKIPEGSFEIGLDDTYGLEATPVHRGKVATFELDTFEVTVADYKKCVKAGKCSAAGGSSVHSLCNAEVAGRGNHPISYVNLEQASAYCDWAGKWLPAVRRVGVRGPREGRAPVPFG